MLKKQHGRRRPKRQDIYQIWPEAIPPRRKRKVRRVMPWGTAGLIIVGVFVGGMTASAWNAKAPPEIRQAPLAMLDGIEKKLSRDREVVSDISAASRAFGMCHTGGGQNCVVDGDTFWMDGEKIRVADIDAPETHPPRCSYEADLGNRATNRLHELLNAGPVQLQPLSDRDVDRYGRKLRIVVRHGRSLGNQLVTEGLARTWTGRREPWC